MHGIDGDHGISQAKRSEQSLHSGDLIGLVVTVDMRQHQSGAVINPARVVAPTSVK